MAIPPQFLKGKGKPAPAKGKPGKSGAGTHMAKCKTCGKMEPVGPNGNCADCTKQNARQDAMGNLSAKFTKK